MDMYGNRGKDNLIKVFKMMNINWENGPTSAQVNAVTDKYQYGKFDGMTDSYDYTNNRDDISQVKYVQTSRELTDEVRLEAKKSLIKKYGILNELDEQEWQEKTGRWSSDKIYAELRDKDLS